MKMSINVNKTLQRFFGLCLLLFFWELNTSFQIYTVFNPNLSQAYFPSIFEIGKQAIKTVFSIAYAESLTVTLVRCLFSFFFASLIGITLAVLTYRSTLLDNLIFYPVEFFRQLPAVAIIPFAIMFFGIQSEMKIFVAFIGTVFPFYVVVRESFNNVNSVLLKTARAYGWKGGDFLFGILIPSSLGAIFSALRVILAISLILTIMSEMLVGGDGIGARLVNSERSFDYVDLYSETLLLGIVGVILSNILITIENNIIFWNSATLEKQ